MSKLKLVYAATAAVAALAIKDGFSQRNPDYFGKVENDVSEVIVFGDYPAIVEAYGEVKDCYVKEKKIPAPAKEKAPAKATKAEVAAKLEEKRIADETAKVEAMDEAALKAHLIEGGSAEAELAELDVETLRSMAIDAISATK